jgi:Tfp pilus assembly protein FimT
MAVLAALAIPRYANATANYRADAAARRIAADLSLVRSQARLTSKPLTVVFTKSSNSYQIDGMPDLLHRSNTYSVQISAHPYYATFVNIVFSGSTQVTFDQYGVPNTGGTVTINVGDVRKSIMLDGTTGRASIQ